MTWKPRWGRSVRQATNGRSVRNVQVLAVASELTRPHQGSSLIPNITPHALPANRVAKSRIEIVDPNVLILALSPIAATALGLAAVVTAGQQRRTGQAPHNSGRTADGYARFAGGLHTLGRASFAGRSARSVNCRPRYRAHRGRRHVDGGSTAGRFPALAVMIHEWWSGDRGPSADADRIGLVPHPVHSFCSGGDPRTPRYGGGGWWISRCARRRGFPPFREAAGVAW
jgi:hypothetical protein